MGGADLQLKLRLRSFLGGADTWPANSRLRGGADSRLRGGADSRLRGGADSWLRGGVDSRLRAGALGMATCTGSTCCNTGYDMRGSGGRSWWLNLLAGALASAPLRQTSLVGAQC